MQYSLIEVNNQRTSEAFLLLPIKLYKNENNWIRPLDKDINNVFNTKENKLFRNGEAIRWILKNKEGEVVGRVAAFVDYTTAKKNEQPTGGMGFFECINCKESATILFNACKDWLQSKGMEAMDGPINFGERDRWWGLLVEGHYEPNYCMGYHLPYYKQLFENYGFRTFFKQFTYHMPVDPKCVKPIMWEKASRIEQNPEFSIKNISRKKLPEFANDFITIYNKAWGRYAGVSRMRKPQAMALLKSIKPILDERLMLFAYYKNEPIAFLIMIPDLNQIVKHLNGKLNLFGKLKLMYLLKVKKICKKALGLIFGIIPQHQGKGVDGALVKGFADNAKHDNYPYTDIEMNWIGDFNPTMCKMVEQLGAKVRKTHLTYRYMFDPNKEVKPPKRVS